MGHHQSLQIPPANGNTAPTTPPPTSLATPPPISMTTPSSIAPLATPPYNHYLLYKLDSPPPLQRPHQHHGHRVWNTHHPSLCSAISCWSHTSHPWHACRDLQAPELILKIRDQTNAHTREVMGPTRYAEWTVVSTEELKAFLEFNFLTPNHL